jgi:SAM-dependent methyltransferase
VSQTDADKWDERYRSDEATAQLPHPLVLRAADSLPPGHALDLACGLGRHTLVLVARGWSVTAVDASSVALQRLQSASANSRVEIVHADLTANEFALLPLSYDLIVKVHYLQRDLFASLKQAVRVSGLFVAVIAMLDEDPQVKPMNPAFCLQPDELKSYFADWDLIHYQEGKKSQRRAMAEIIARRLP